MMMVQTSHPAQTKCLAQTNAAVRSLGSKVVHWNVSRKHLVQQERKKVTLANVVKAQVPQAVAGNALETTVHPMNRLVRVGKRPLALPLSKASTDRSVTQTKAATM